MRILVISDSHGRNDDVKGVIEQVGDFDMLIHCGDIERGDDYIKALVKCPVHMVSGNNDYNLELPMQEVFDVEGYRIMVTHGHYYYVNSGVHTLEAYCLENGIDVAMYGHTHVPFIEIGEKVTILNPGSISYPRQEGRKPTFLIMEIDEKGDAHYAHGYYKSKYDWLK